MFKNIEFSEHAGQLGDIIEMLAAIVVNMKEAFMHQQSRSLEGLDKQYMDLNEEIAFDATIADELMIGKSLDDKEPIFRYQKILTHLQTIDNSLHLLADVFKKQIKEQVLLTDKDIQQVTMMLERQENILRALAVAVRDVDRNRLNTANRECHEISNSCINFATTYESRLVEGLCTPRSAPILLNVFDRLQTLVHNELETVKLLSRWIWDCVAMGSEEYRDVHYSY